MAGTKQARDHAVAKAEQTRHAPEQAPQKTLLQLIEDLGPQVARALPSHLSTERFTRIALTLVRQNPQLLECSQQSVLGALMLAAQHGLEPGPLGLSYIIPRWNKNTRTKEAQFQIGYRGYLELARRSGDIAMIDAEVVREHDDFDYEKGLQPRLRHVPADGDRGRVVKVWAAATFVNGGSAFKVLTVDDVESYRKRSQSPNQGPWTTDWEQMAIKTALRRLSTFLPLSAEGQMVISADEGVVHDIPVGEDLQVSHEQPGAVIDVEGNGHDQADADADAAEQEAADGQGGDGS